MLAAIEEATPDERPRPAPDTTDFYLVIAEMLRTGEGVSFIREVTEQDEGGTA